jgi:hypothetical protein
MLENNEKNYLKILYLLDWYGYGGSKGAALISFILNIKKDFSEIQCGIV